MTGEAIPVVWTFHAASEDDTRRLGEAIGAAALSGLVIALVGQLGAGKTRLVRAIADGAGVRDQIVNSPTYVLVQEYHGRLPIYHFDTYRLRSLDEFIELGAEEYLGADGVCCIEWADRVADVLPPDVLRIEIAVVGRDDRRFGITANGPTSASVLFKFRTALS
ncbi:MAG: tRNA (adenosine(37)-N6)-threonylcarbamoyltransferase complex ATPase subunit type 1 TsaE [Planctomycetales bacterium]|nr:tRNA (adenosine(37)-N6)-threonylcarbamoyltransferase complex ATPase subunit type 1 TsaE [Planctomycetales bacterium]